MEIREKHSLIRLLLESFALVNRCGGALVGYLLAAVLFVAAEAALLWIGVPNFILKLANIFFSAYFAVVLLRIFGAKAERTDETVSNSLSAAVFPAFYQLIFNILYGAVWVIVGLVFAFVFKGSTTLSLWMMSILTHTAGSGTIVSIILTVAAISAVPLYIGARLLYAPAAIALREQGPIAAIIYSFQLTSGKRILTALGALLITILLPIAFIATILYGGYVIIPLHFADSFNLAQLTPAWIGVLAVIALVYLLILLALPAFLVLVFLNQDYGHNRDSFTPQAELKLTSQETKVFGADNNILPPGAGNIVRQEDVRGVEVVKSSVSAMPDDGITQQHLQQVYKPKPEDLVQYAEEEDRMPTILFDDDIARQIEQERNMWQNKQQQDKTQKGEDDAPSVKMSK
uniref:Glycerophosphoryl diester phosphodiesterase membrane domain-containing protein n=1 Tax=uncultured Elusimicrobia bacterium TaxID=699876 RepID=A0A650ELX5_9BACT|nr:hypothetical protein Elusimicrob1349_0760 [uncultured Elusimicrobia bacterium]